MYYCYLNYLGGLKLIFVGELKRINFECLLEILIKGMLLSICLGEK